MPKTATTVQLNRPTPSSATEASGLLGDRGREMLGAAKMAKGWTSHIAKMAETLDGRAKPADKTKDKTIPCLNCQRVAVLSKSGKTYVCQMCGKREAA